MDRAFSPEQQLNDKTQGWHPGLIWIRTFGALCPKEGEVGILCYSKSEMKTTRWHLTSFALVFILLISYLGFRANTNITELEPIEKALKGAVLVSVRVVSDSSASKAFVPRPEVQKIYVVHDKAIAVSRNLSASSPGWFWTFPSCAQDLGGAIGTWPIFIFGDLPLKYSGRVQVSVVPGKATEKTKFGLMPSVGDSEYSTVYLSWVKNDIVSHALSSIKR